MTEPSLRDQLVADYLSKEDAIERAASPELWALADWLAKYVPPRDVGRPTKKVGQPTISLTLADVAALGRRSRPQLMALRKTAIATEVDRLPQVTPTAYYEALVVTKWDLMDANHRLVTRGHTKRDQREGPHESVKAIKRELAKRSPEDRAAVIREMSADPTVAELLGDIDPASFGAEWADKLVVRVHEVADRLATHVQREGLRFAPSTELDDMYGFLIEAERWIAEVRAAVQERINDERAEVSR